MRPVIRWTLWQRRWSIFWWCAGVMALVGLELGVYSSIRGQAAQLNDALHRLPGSVRSLFGGSTDLFSPVGYLNSRLFYLLFPLLLSILAIGLGSSLLAREETSSTLELLLARPISRGKLLLAKAMAGTGILLIVWLAASASTLLLSRVVGIDVPVGHIAFVAAAAGMLALVFGALAFFVASLGTVGRGASLGVASLLSLGGYIVSSLEANVHWLSWPAKIFPYHYYNSLSILYGWYSWGVILSYALMVLGLGILAWLAFRRRDLNG